MAEHLRTWKDAQEVLGKRDSRKVANNTYLKRLNDNSIGLKLHNTFILVWRAGVGVEYNTGGWRTYVTKERMNRFGPLSIWSDRGTWWCSLHGPWSVDRPKWVYEEGLTFHEDGTITGAGDDPTKARKMRKVVAKFCRDYMDALERGEVPAPSGGDCWYCALTNTKTGKPLGEGVDTLHQDGSITVERNTDHILSHLGLGEPVEEREVYFVPSLLHNALKAGPTSKTMWWWVGSFWNPNSSFCPGSERDRVEKLLRKYILRQLGMAA